MEPSFLHLPLVIQTRHSYTLIHDVGQGNCSIFGGSDLGHLLYFLDRLAIPYELGSEERYSRENWEEWKVDAKDITWLGIIILLVAQSLWGLASSLLFTPYIFILLTIQIIIPWYILDLSMPLPMHFCYLSSGLFVLFCARSTHFIVQKCAAGFLTSMRLVSLTVLPGKCFSWLSTLSPGEIQLSLSNKELLLSTFCIPSFPDAVRES